MDEEIEMVVVTARLPADLVEWVNDEFPHGFKQSFILQCFLSLRHVLVEGELPPPSEYARAASMEAIIELSGPAPTPDV